MGRAADEVSPLEGLGHFGPNLLDDAGVVAAYTGADNGWLIRSEVNPVDVLPICGIQRHGCRPDEYVVVSKRREGDRLDLGLAYGGNDNSPRFARKSHSGNCVLRKGVSMMIVAKGRRGVG